MLKRCLLVFCGVLCLLTCATGSVFAISAEQKAMIADNCTVIREDLKKVQRSDARARVYLGGKYELILNKYVTPLNVRLVENSLSSVSFIENQNTMASNKMKFANDYVEYQQRLEELVSMDCKNESEAFYKKLEEVRTKRKKVEQDVKEMRNSLTKFVELVGKLKETLNAKTK